MVDSVVCSGGARWSSGHSSRCNSRRRYMAPVKLGGTFHPARGFVSTWFTFPPLALGSTPGNAAWRHGIDLSLCMHRETAAIEDPSIYHPLLTLLSSPESIAALDHHPDSRPQSDRFQLSVFYDLLNSSSILLAHPHFDFSSFQASLALHVAQPKLEAYASFYTDQVIHMDCQNWVWWREKGYCDTDILKKEMEETIDGHGNSS